ncbi:hypothetical protein [Azospirillum ramasamyi]|uniref:UvrABC system protein A n=1 Tax=Azospirillum ramasamyi TaxID=682998 RepID=A0A2U9SH85_9PROT|nr:hypothetical protein [Azospirillum ramasamyi]AWU98067.1 hypothetical protein DM194_27650 [Azospirillum ramasamyi]
MSTRPTDRATPELQVVGADANNLRSVDCAFPVPGMTAIVGVSGSGKSSLLGDTVAAELIRRDRLLFGLPHAGRTVPPVAAYVGPAPASLHVTQRPFRASARTTVATASGLLAELRHLFLADGRVLTPEGAEVSAPDPRTYAAWMKRHYRGTAAVWAIPMRWVAGDGVRAVRRLLDHDITSATLRGENDRLGSNGRVVDLTRWSPLRSKGEHLLEAEVGRIVVGPNTSNGDLEALIARAWAIAGPDVMVELCDGFAGIDGPFGAVLDGARDRVHPDCRQLFLPPSLHLLSFNAPDHADSGACPRCLGLGRTSDVDEAALVPHPERSLREGAISLWSPTGYKHVNIQHETIEALTGRNDFWPDLPWTRLPEAARTLLLNGTGDEPIQGIDPKTGRKKGAPRRFEGFRNAILRRWSSSATAAARLAHLVHEGSCPDCGGTRWSAKARALHAAGIGLAEWIALPMAALAERCVEVLDREPALLPAGRQALERIGALARTLCRLGLGHIAGERGMTTLSDGEARRLQIGAVLALPVEQLVLLLDEPARGLHETDLDTMIEVLRELARKHGVLLNEHRTKLVASADRVIRLGPGAGEQGGHILKDWREPPPLATLRVAPPSGDFIEIRGATVHNVHSQDVTIPLGAVTAIVGVSGSGKSSFVRGVLIPALESRGVPMLHGADPAEATAGTWAGARIDRPLAGVHVLHQRVPPRNRRSLVGTLTKAMDALAEAFAQTALARAAGLSAEDFRLNSGNGRCPVCLGTGMVAEDGAAACCATCGGKRYRTAALAPTVAGLDIAATLDCPAVALRRLWDEAGETALAVQLGPLCAAMEELGVGHLAFGRRVDTLSGGEIQRLRVALTLAGGEAAEGHLFILDEPAAGLHREDAMRLNAVLRRMADGHRNTVVLIEHNLDVVSDADWLVEFGEGAGENGGRVIAQAPPAAVASGDTPTGRSLRAAAERAPTRRKPSPLLHAASPVPAVPVLELGRLVDGDLADCPAGDPTPAFERLLDPKRRLWEIADLNLEFAKLLIDGVQATAAQDEAALLERWEAEPDAELAVNPLLPDLRQWGSHLPRSVMEAAFRRVRQLALRVPGVWEPGRPGAARAMLDNAAGPANRRDRLRHALAVGGGYAELSRPAGTVLAAVQRTPVDFERGLAGPARLTPTHVSRFLPEGQCPTCAGTGTVRTLNPDLVLAGARAAPDDPSAYLRPEAAALMKGVWRAEFRPFLRRMAEEGLLEGDAAWIRSGHWQRPGHGSFLKTAKADPDEVASWLRWDGLDTRLLAELPRSRHASWRAAVEASVHTAPCPACGGSGHGVAVRLLTFGGRLLDAWIRSGTIGELCSALAATPVDRPRQRLTRDRVLGCFEPLVRSEPDTPLKAPAAAFRTVAQEAMRRFTDLEYGA